MLLKDHQLPKNYLWMDLHLRVYFLQMIYLWILKLFVEEKQF